MPQVSIPTTFVGSLPRPASLTAMLLQKLRGEIPSEQDFTREVSTAVQAAVALQAQAGLTYLSDGEQGELAYFDPSFRFSGFSTGEPTGVGFRDMVKRPLYLQQFAAATAGQAALTYQCTSRVSYQGHKALEQRLDDFRQALQSLDIPLARGFLTAPSPGIIAFACPDDFYHELQAYLHALALAMREEYQGILEAGFTLQVDCPDLGTLSRLSSYSSERDPAYLQRVNLHVAALQEALAGLPAERIRLHACYGNAGSPHDDDAPIDHVLDLLYQFPASILSFVGANPRHHFEWKVFRQHPLPAGRRLAPGVVDSTSNILEHPETIAEYLVNLASVVGADRIIASSDCGFGTLVQWTLVAPDVVADKLRVIVEGAALASERLSHIQA